MNYTNQPRKPQSYHQQHQRPPQGRTDYNQRQQSPQTQNQNQNQSPPSVFTHLERTVKRIDVNFVAKQVRDVLTAKGIAGMNLTNMPKDEGQLYTVEQSSHLVDRIVYDSRYGTRIAN